MGWKGVDLKRGAGFESGFGGFEEGMGGGNCGDSEDKAGAG